jgi:hypothetical protein
MLPRTAAQYVVNLGAADAKPLAKLDLGCGALAISLDDLSHIHGSQSCSWITLTPLISQSRRSPMFYRIPMVPGSRIPPQVRQPVVGPDPIIVASFHSFGAGTHEGFKDETVDEFSVLPSTTI